jgi:hypothetical protein
MARLRLTNQQHFIRLAVLFIMLGLFLKALSMPSAPVHFDTNYYLNIGTNFINHGELTPYMWRLDPDTNIIAGSGTGYGVLLLTYWLKIFGVSLYAGYALMYIVGILSLVVLFFLVRTWWQSWVAALAAVAFTALSSTFMVQFYVRMDAPAVLVYLLILWLHIWAVRTKRRWAHFGVGVSVILATEVHIQALLYVGALSLYYLLQHIYESRQKRRLFMMSSSIYFFAGAFLAGIIYLIVHVLPDTEAYFIIARRCERCEPAGLFKELLRYIMFIQQRTIDMFVFVMALGLILAHRSEADNHYLTLVLGYFLAQAVVSPPTDIHYMTHVLPLLGLAVGSVFIKPDENGNRVTKQHIVLGGAVAGFMFFAQFIIVAINMGTPEPTPDGVDYVREHVPHETVIMGHPTLYHHFLEYDNFISYRDGVVFSVILEGIDFQTFWEREQPQVLIGELGADDKDRDWLMYMRAHDFKQVRDAVWISGDLWEALTVGYTAPEVSFAGNQSSVMLGDCTKLEWNVTNADTVTLNGSSVQSVASQEVCPISTTTYTISAFWIGGVKTAYITIVVE